MEVRRFLSKTSNLQPDEFFGYIVLFYTVFESHQINYDCFFIKYRKEKLPQKELWKFLNAENEIKDLENALVKSEFTNEIEFKKHLF